MFQAGVPDIIIKERSGQLSMYGLRQYRQEQEENVLKVWIFLCFYSAISYVYVILSNCSKFFFHL